MMNVLAPKFLHLDPFITYHRVRELMCIQYSYIKDISWQLFLNFMRKEECSK